MEAALPNLLIRTVTDPLEGTFSRGVSEVSHDHDPFSVSFRSKPASAGGGGGGSPLAVSPPGLRLGVKGRKDVSPRSVVTPLNVWPPSNEGPGKTAGGGGEGEVDMLGRTRLLSLGIWDDGAGLEDLNAAAAVVADVVPHGQDRAEEEEEEEVKVVAKGGGSLQLQG